MELGVGAWGTGWRAWFWKFYLGFSLALLPISFPMFFGYIFWCRWMEKRCQTGQLRKG